MQPFHPSHPASFFPCRTVAEPGQLTELAEKAKRSYFTGCSVSKNGFPAGKVCMCMCICGYEHKGKNHTSRGKKPEEAQTL